MLRMTPSGGKRINTCIVCEEGMDDFVKSLTHVHSETDVDNQWKRAIKSLASMSNMDVAIAWLHLSKYALKLGGGNSVSEFKAIYKRALREYEKKEALDIQNDNLCMRQKAAASSVDIEKLSREIQNLRAAVAAFVVKHPTHTSENHSASTDEVEFVEAPTSDVSRPNSAPADSRPVLQRKADASNPTEQLGAQMWKEMLEKCCKENQTVCEGIGEKVEDVKQVVEEIRTTQLALTAKVILDSEGMTEFLDRECIAKLIPLADKLETTDQKVQQLIDRPDPAEIFRKLQDEQAVRIQIDATKSMESIQTAVADLITVKLDEIRETIYDEFQQQTTAVLEHENENLAFVERTAKTLESIPGILKSYETSNEKSSVDMLTQLAEIVDSIKSSTTGDAELKNTVTERIDSMVKLQRETKDALSKALTTALITNSEMLKLVKSMSRRSGSAFTTGGGGSTPSMSQKPGRPEKGWSTDESTESDGEHRGAAASRAVAIDKSGAAIPKQVLAVLPLSGATEKRRREKVAQTTAKKAAESLNAEEAAKKAATNKAAAKPPP
jgi:hypothetical protein